MHQPLVKYSDIPLPQLISDLKWVVNSPGLLIDVPPQINWKLLRPDYFENSKEWLADIEQNPRVLKEFFNSENQFILGKYFELLVQFIINKIDEYSLITSGLQVIKNGKTLGEIDFVYKNLNNGIATHLEVAVKYYMGYKSSAKHSMWIGPNGMDNLAGKIQKFTTQLSMAGFAEELIDFNPASFERKVLLKGYFFKHIRTDLMPHFCNPEALAGEWLYISELDEIINPNIKYTIVPKRLWLGFYFDKDLEIFDCRTAIEIVESEILKVGKGILLAELNEGENLINTIYMIVPNRWPCLT